MNSLKNEIEAVINLKNNFRQIKSIRKIEFIRHPYLNIFVYV